MPEQQDVGFLQDEGGGENARQFQNLGKCGHARSGKEGFNSNYEMLGCGEEMFFLCQGGMRGGVRCTT